MSADSVYSINPWMRPEERLGDTDQVLPPLAVDWVGVVQEQLAMSPVPPPAGYTPRLGWPTGEPTVDDVLSLPPVGGMARPGEAGPQGTLRDSLGR